MQLCLFFVVLDGFYDSKEHSNIEISQLKNKQNISVILYNSVFKNCVIFGSASENRLTYSRVPFSLIIMMMIMRIIIIKGNNNESDSVLIKDYFFTWTYATSDRLLK